MKLNDLLINDRLPADFDPQSNGLVFGDAVHAALTAAQDDQHQHRIAPVATTDGRWVSCADVLTEATSGIFSYIFQQMPRELAAEVDVVPWSDAVALLPVPESMEIGM